MDVPVAHGAPRSQSPSWGELAQRNWAQYVATGLLVGLVKWSDSFEPFHKPMYGGSDAEYWRYSYPHFKESIPDWVVPILSLVVPAAVICMLLLARGGSRMEAHHAILMLVACVLTTGLVTNVVKVQVGRPRPDFVYHCWPRTLKPVFNAKGLPLCEKGVDAAELAKARRSFPSGHTSWTAAGLGFLAVWLAGHFRCFNGAAQPVRLVICLAPLLGVLIVAMNRIRTCKHHTEDVIAGTMLGVTLAYAFYREVFAGLFSASAGRLVSEATARKEGQAADEERQSLLGEGAV